MTIPAPVADSLDPDASASPTTKEPAPPRGRVLAVVSVVLVVVGVLVAAVALFMPARAEQLSTSDERLITDAAPANSTSGTASTKAITAVSQHTGPDPAGSGDWWFVVFFENSSAAGVYADTPLTITALDSTGAVVGVDEQSATFMPGPNLVAGRFSAVGDKEVTSLEVTLAAEAAVIPFDSDAPKWDLDLVSSVVDVADGTAVARGTVRNTSASPMKNTDVIVLAWHASGADVNVASIPLPTLAPGEETAFEASFPGGIAPGTEFTAVVQP